MGFKRPLTRDEDRARARARARGGGGSGALLCAHSHVAASPSKAIMGTAEPGWRADANRVCL